MITEPIKEVDEGTLADSATDAGTSMSGSLISSITGYWSSSPPASPSKRLSIARQQSIVINQSGQLYSDLSEIPPGVDVVYVEEKEEQAGLWDFFHHVMGDEEDDPESQEPRAPDTVVGDGRVHDDVSQGSGEPVLQESPRRRNSVGGGGKSTNTAKDISPATEGSSSTPVQEVITAGHTTPVMQDFSSNRSRCIMCGRNCMTVHNSNSRSRSV